MKRPHIARESLSAAPDGIADVACAGTASDAANEGSLLRTQATHSGPGGTMDSSSAENRMQDTYRAATGTGWITFAAIMFLISGIFHVIDGIAALANSDYLLNEIFFANLEFWGVVWLIIGGLALYAAWAILARSEAGRIIGIGLASLSIITQLMFIAANPWWAIVVITIDFFILYALIVRGDEFGIA
jgi:hypothetical protein